MALVLVCLLAGGGPLCAGTPALRFEPVTLSAQDRDALGRLAYAEAGNQGAAGLAAVVYAVLNRLASGHFGNSIQQVIDAPGQFEPVSRSGGTWRNLPALTAVQNATFEAILDLIVDGRLPDPTKGATYFQNPALVAQREAAGLVSPGLTNFGGVKPLAVIKDQAFYDHIAVRSAKAEGSALIYHGRVLWLNIRRTANAVEVVSIQDAGPAVTAVDPQRISVFRGQTSSR